MSVRSVSLQDLFLNSIRRTKVPVGIFLVKGVKLQGLITSFDTFSVMLRRDGVSQLVYKHSISTIVPATRLPDLSSELEQAAGGQRGKPALQDLFLAAAEREGERMTLFLVNGVMLQGSVKAFDQFSLLLERGAETQLVYKHAISTLQPEHALHLDPGTPEEAAKEEA